MIGYNITNHFKFLKLFIFNIFKTRYFNMKNLNFGIIKESVLAKLTELYIKDNYLNFNITNDFFNTINESKILKLQNDVYDKLTTKVIESENLATRYIDNTMKLFEDINISEYNIGNKILEDFMTKYGIDVINNGSSINECIDTLIKNSLNSKKRVNVDLLHESFITILETVKTKKESPIINEEISEPINSDILRIAVNRYNKKYSDLTESDNKVLKVLAEGDMKNKINLFNTLKEDIAKILGDLNEDVDKVNATIAKIDEMPKELHTINESIITIYDLKCNFEEN